MTDSIIHHANNHTSMHIHHIIHIAVNHFFLFFIFDFGTSDFHIADDTANKKTIQKKFKPSRFVVVVVILDEVLLDE